MERKVGMNKDEEEEEEDDKEEEEEDVRSDNNISGEGQLLLHLLLLSCILPASLPAFLSAYFLSPLAPLSPLWQKSLPSSSSYFGDDEDKKTSLIIR